MEQDFKKRRPARLDALGAKPIAPDEGGSEDRPYEVRSLSRAVAILDAFGDSESLNLVELGRRLQLPKPTLFRLASALEGEGLLERGPSGKYRLGYRLVSLARRVLSNELVQAARPLMTGLFDAFGHSVNLGVVSGGEVLFLSVVQSRHRVRMVSEIGSREPIHATAIGKAIAAALSPERVAALLRDRPLHAITSRTITSRAQFDVELEVTRERGFAIDVGECQDDANCVAAAVFDGTGVIAGISVSATAGQMPAADLPLVGAAVAETARKLSANLGQRPDRGQSGSTSRLSSQSQWSTS